MNRKALACLAAVWAVSVWADDALTKAVDPYDMADQKVKFIKAAGNTNELDEKKFLADQKAGGNLIQPFEKWTTAIAFDKDKNGTLDWFEFEAYRQAMRAAVLAGFDKNKDGKLTGPEREAALKALTDGKVTIKPPAETGRGAIPPTFTPPARDGRTAASQPASGPTSRPARWDPPAELVQKYDTDGDGKLSDDEYDAMIQDLHQRYLDHMRQQTQTRDRQRQSGKEQFARVDRGGQFGKELLLAQPMQEFLLRNFDTDGDGKLSDEETKAAQAFQMDLSLSTMGCCFITLQEIVTEDGKKAMQADSVHRNMFDAIRKRANGDGPPPQPARDAPPEDWVAYQRAVAVFQTKQTAVLQKVAAGMARYATGFEKQALADNGGKPSTASRAAMLLALDLDMERRMSNAGSRGGHPTPEIAEKFIQTMLDEFLKDE